MSHSPQRKHNRNHPNPSQTPPDEAHHRAPSQSSNPSIATHIATRIRSIASTSQPSAKSTMYILRRILTLLLLTTLTSGYPPRYSRRRRQISRPWLETPGADVAMGGQTSQMPAVAVDMEAGQLIELVVKTVVATVIVTTAELSSHEEGSEEE